MLPTLINETFPKPLSYVFVTYISLEKWCFSFQVKIRKNECHLNYSTQFKCVVWVKALNSLAPGFFILKTRKMTM